MTGEPRFFLNAKGLFFLFILLSTTTCCWQLSVISAGAASESWPTVEGVITFAEVRVHQPSVRDRRELGLKTRYTPRITYRYQVDGKTYENHVIGRYGYTSKWASGISRGQYAVGKPVTVYYNPENPAESVLEPGLGGYALAPCGLALLFLALAVRFGWQAIRKSS